MARKPRKPAKVEVGKVKARPVRPRGTRGPEDGRWHWQAVVYTGEGGGSRTVWTGWATRDEATVALSGLVAEEGPAPARPGPPEPVATLATVRDLLECWAAHRMALPHIKPATARNSRNRARHAASHLGEIRTDRLGIRDLEAFRDARLRQDAATSQVQKELQEVRMAWAWARARGYVPDRDLPKVRLRVTPKRERYTPTRAEVLAVIANLAGWQQTAVILLYGTGARVGEVATLRWKDVDLDRGEAYFDGKTGGRWVPPSRDILAHLETLPHKEPESFVLGVSPHLVRGKLSHVHIREVCDTLEIRRFTPHGIRRAAVDLLATAGVDIGTAASILGHSPAVMLRHYRQATRADRRRAIDASGLGALPDGNVYPMRRTRPEPVQNTRTGEPTTDVKPDVPGALAAGWRPRQDSNLWPTA